MSTKKKIFSAVVILVVVSAIAYFEGKKPDRSGGGRGESIAVIRSEKTSLYPQAKELVSPSGFINTDLFALEDYIGEKVVLLDFWTYSCINCQRTTPYLNAWYEKYVDRGLVIVGVHAPEFEFEENYENVLRAVREAGIEYPVVQDNDYGTWRAYGNRFWPRKYLIDIDGFIRYDHIGEGAYEETEEKIQELLRERATRLGLADEVPEDVVVSESPDAPERGISPETYFGNARNDNFGSGTSGSRGTETLLIPSDIVRDTLYLEGAWNIELEYAENVSEGSRIVFRYRAADVHFVASADGPVNAVVLRDGEPVPEELMGKSVRRENGETVFTVHDATLYNLIEGDEDEHTIEIIIRGEGLQAFTFTFG